MLFHYAVAATNDNWLHDTLLQILVAGMDQLDAEQALSAWPACIPIARREVLSPKTGLQDRLSTFFKVFAALDKPSRDSVRNALEAQNAIPAVFDGASPWVRLEELPQSIREPAKELFKFAFGLLTHVGLRDEHYRVIWQNLTWAKICPFCGLERLKHPNQPRPDLDHYLPISRYPFAGANLRNLVPMGGDCNSAFKGQIDIVCDATTKTRRRCSDPYAGPVFSVSLKGSNLFEGDGTICPLPAWDIAFHDAAHDSAATWEAVFQIKRRYSDILNEEYHSWINHFAHWCADDRSGVQLTDAQSGIAVINQYIDTILQEGLGDTNFLKRATFQMLSYKLDADPQASHLVEWLVFLERFSTVLNRSGIPFGRDF
jgi:hypothetical protein